MYVVLRLYYKRLVEDLTLTCLLKQTHSLFDDMTVVLVPFTNTQRRSDSLNVISLDSFSVTNYCYLIFERESVHVDIFV